MKKYFKYFLIISIFSCDKIENPLPEEYGKFDWSLYPGDPADYSYDLVNPENNWGPNNNPKSILLEDYTGHKCTNCPEAAQIAKDLEDDTSKNVIVSTIHASQDGTFQSTDNIFINNYETEAGNEYVRGSEMPGFLGNPMGTINRNDGGLSNSSWYFASDWLNGVNNELNSAFSLNIQLQYYYFTQTNGLFIHTETSILNDLTGEYHLVIYLIRDDIVSPQKFNSGIIDTNYHHHAVLSDNINGTWGTPIINGTAEKDSMIYNNFTYELIDPSIDSTYSIDNLSLISYVIDRNTLRVIQVIKTKLNY
ncbi:MAG: hypothetical protein CL851_02625 [Crocinitomicaceae bacterium]|nr:hypothetical protein [Crocinitomicaceae bacterium]